MQEKNNKENDNKKESIKDLGSVEVEGKKRACNTKAYRGRAG